MLTKTQINRIRKAASKRTGVDLKMSMTQIRKAIQKGGSLFLALMPSMLGKVLLYASKVAGPLVTGALSGLSSLGVNKLFSSGHKGGFLIQSGVVSQLLTYLGHFSVPQQRKILKSEQTGTGLVLIPTVSQRGGFIGSFLASIGIPMLLQGLMGGKGYKQTLHLTHHVDGVSKSIFQAITTAHLYFMVLGVNKEVVKERPCAPSLKKKRKKKRLQLKKPRRTPLRKTGKASSLDRTLRF